MSHTHQSPTKPYEADAPHARLQALVGSYTGPTRTFMEPYSPNDESSWTVEIVSVLGGRFVELDYASTIMGGPHAGRLLLGHHNGAFQAVWTDSFHTGTDAIVFAETPGREGEIAFNGSYTYEGQRFGWRIHIRQPDADHVEIDHVNIMPDGEFPAIETRLARNQ